jgi:hypothetical protein
LFVQTKAILPGVLTRQLRTRQVRRRPQRRVNPANDRAPVTERPSIRARPLECSTDASPAAGKVTCSSTASAAAT